MAQKDAVRHFLLCVFPLMVGLLLAPACGKGGKEAAQQEEEYFHRANRAQMERRFADAVAIYEEFVAKFPASPRLDKALFMIGFIKSENLNDIDGALRAFRQLTKECPRSDLADDAAFMIKALESGTDPVDAFQKSISQ